MKEHLNTGWQKFRRTKKWSQNFRQARICYFRNKFIFLRIIANTIQYFMQYKPCNSALLAQEALFLPKKALFMPKDLQKKVRKSRQILIRDKIAYVRA